MAMTSREKEFWVFLPLSIGVALFVSFWALGTAIYTDFGEGSFSIAWKSTRQVVYGLAPWAAVIAVLKRRFDFVGAIWLLTALISYWASPLWGKLIVGVALALIPWAYHATQGSRQSEPHDLSS